MEIQYIEDFKLPYSYNIKPMKSYKPTSQKDPPKQQGDNVKILGNGKTILEEVDASFESGTNHYSYSYKVKFENGGKTNIYIEWDKNTKIGIGVFGSEGNKLDSPADNAPKKNSNGDNVQLCHVMYVKPEEEYLITLDIEKLENGTTDYTIDIEPCDNIPKYQNIGYNRDADNFVWKASEIYDILKDDHLPQYGERSEAVKKLQEMLIEANAWTREDIGATGYFGDITKESLSRFQEWCMLEWNRMDNDIRGKLREKNEYLSSIKTTGTLNNDTLYALEKALQKGADVEKLLLENAEKINSSKNKLNAMEVFAKEKKMLSNLTKKSVFDEGMSEDDIEIPVLISGGHYSERAKWTKYYLENPDLFNVESNYEVVGRGYSIGGNILTADGQITVVYYDDEKLSEEVQKLYPDTWDKPIVYGSTGVNVSTLGSLKGVIKTGEKMLKTGKLKPKVTPSVNITYVEVMRLKDYDEFDPKNLEKGASSVGVTILIVTINESTSEDKKVSVINLGASTPNLDFNIGASYTKMLDKKATDKFFEEPKCIDYGPRF